MATSSVPAVATLFAAADATHDRTDPASFWGLGSAFEAFASSQDAVDLLVAKLSRLAHHPTDTLRVLPGFSWRVGGVGGVSLFLRLLFPEATDPEDAPAHRLWAPADGAPLPLTLSAPVGMADPEVQDDGIHLGAPVGITIAPGRPRRLRARLDVVEPAFERPRLIYELTGPPVYGERWIYDAASRRLAWSMTASRALTQLDYTLAVLRDLGDEAAWPALERLATRHPAHFVRYRALEATLAAAPSHARALLEAMRDDPHPHLRAVVRGALEEG